MEAAFEAHTGGPCWTEAQTEALLKPLHSALAITRRLDWRNASRVELNMTDRGSQAQYHCSCDVALSTFAFWHDCYERNY